ncbi:MAG: hypothetical protein Q9213_006464 [Squamulea squamosa]
MSMFTALNIEPESDSEDDIDNSKEIQIEEALKLYQTALKLHSQGPQYFDQAEEAYKALFRSEVFTYLEALSEAQRVSYYENVAAPLLRPDEELINESVAVVSSADGAPSTLPQILYLSYKNHGHFLLDRLKYRLSLGWSHGPDQVHITSARREISETIKSSLNLLVEALDRDDTDLELWRQLSKMGESLGSARLARFCLEVVVDRDDISADAWPEPLGLQEILATARLRSLLQRLNDDLGDASIPVLSRKQHALVQSFKAHVDPLPYLPTPPPESPNTKHAKVVLPAASKPQEIVVPLRTWSSCGKAILVQLQRETQGLSNAPPGAGYILVFPSVDLEKHQQRLENRYISESYGQVPPNTTARVEDRYSRTDNNPSLPQYDGVFEASQTSPGASSRLLSESATYDVPEKVEGLAVTTSGAIHRYSNEAPGQQETISTGDLPEDDTRTMTLPTRKRSNEAAELEQGEDTGRSRSKRIKARTSIEEPTPRKDAVARQLEKYQHGELHFYDFLDEQAFGQSAKILSAFGMNAADSVRELKNQVHAIVKPQPDNDRETGNKTTKPHHDALVRDLAISIYNWDNEMGNIFLHGGGFEDPVNGAGLNRNSGLLTFLEQSSVRPRDSPPQDVLDDDRGLDSLVESTRQEWMSLDQLALMWIRTLLSPNSRLDMKQAPTASSYEALVWPDTLKETVVQLLVGSDDFIFSTMSDEVITEPGRGTDKVNGLRKPPRPVHTMIQGIFEIHLDIYGRITNPSSEVDQHIRTAQRDRLRRWASLAYHSIRYLGETCDTVESGDMLCNRFLWAYAVLLNLCELCSRDLVILYFQDLKETFKELGDPVVILCNNEVMPELSAEAAEKQISRLTTMDFFTSVFGTENDDPVKLVESLEPILEMSLQRDQSVFSTLGQSVFDTKTDEENKQGSDRIQVSETSFSVTDSRTEQMLQFLDKASLSVRLLLWRRLIDAYSDIQYPPRILSCYMRCVRIIVGHIYSPEHLEMGEDARRKELLRWMKALDELLTWTLSLALSDTKSLDYMDEENLREAMHALASLQYILHSFVAVEDLIRIGVGDPPKPANNPAKIAYSNAMTRIREMVVKVWTLQYVLMRDSASQCSVEASATNNDLILYLKLTHRLFGPRQYCKLSNKVLLKLLRDEIPRIDNFVDSELESAQLILDLYGLKICPGSNDIEDHDCTPESLDRQNAIAIMDRVIVQANRLNIKDLAKSELRITIEKMQQVIKPPKSTPGILHNRRVYNDFLRSPINPLNLSRATRGISEIHFHDLRGEIFDIAEKGWYFLQGYLALAKYRSQRRTSPAGADELDVALTFLKHDIEQGCEKWETWYRLAQVYDAKVEEETLWTADKLNSNMEEITSLQRNAIHCYSMAVATAEHCAEPTIDMYQKVADLYYDFAARVYGSSREPFAMEAFSVEKFTKHFNAGRLGTYQGKPFKPVTLYGACKFASGLLRRAIHQKPDNWMTWYMLGKCLWKMYKCREMNTSGDHRADFEPALAAFKTAIETLLERRDNKHAEKEPVLEPHYKLASTVHKLVFAEKLQAEIACQILNVTPYARRVPPVQDPDDWEGYILHVLKVLRSADKSNWHHRMVLRAARTIYDGSPNDHLALLGAKSELTPQIFTKTMTIQVWKPHNERVGRHFVYTTRYVQFFIRLLFELRDSAGIEAVGRQIRKKSDKFFKHSALWQETCMTHLTLLRMNSGVPSDYSDSAFKNISHDLFLQNADRLEAWAQQPTTISHKLRELEIIREAIELKKTNAKLIKEAVIEDLIGDVYAFLFVRMTPELIGLENEEESRSRMRVDHLMNSEKPATSTPSPDPAGKADDVAPTRQRIRGVGRKELQKRAEALVVKPVVVQPAVKPPKSPAPTSELLPTPRSTIQVVIKQKDSRNDTPSVRGSLHDSADDESELSDVDDAPETTKARPLFPNLGDSKVEADEDDKEGSDQQTERGDDDAAEERQDERMEEEEEDEADDAGDGEGEGDMEETYHTPMEM